MVSEEMVELAWAAIVGSDIAAICFQANVVRGDIRTALEAALRAAVPEGEVVAVKPLEWEYAERPTMTYTAFWADGEIAYYIDQGFGSDSYYFRTVRWPEETIYDGDDLEAAKAAAFADKERRIRSEVISASAADGPLAWAFRNNAEDQFSVSISEPQICYEKRPLYTHPAPRPDLERELAEARAELAVAKQEAAAMREQSVKNARERNALAADKARLVAALERAAQIAGDAAWSRPMPKNWDRDKDEYTDWCAAQSKFVREKILALSGASIPAPADKAEARREALIEHLRSEFSGSYDCTRVWEAWSYNTMTEDDFEPITDRLGEIADGILALISTPARREALEEAAGAKHAFEPHPKYPQFCNRCGYSRNEPLQHALSTPARREGE